MSPASARDDKRQRNGDEYICSRCDIRFNSEEAFEDHVTHVHGTTL